MNRLTGGGVPLPLIPHNRVWWLLLPNADPVDDILRSNVGIEQLFGTDGWERYLEGFVKLAWMDQVREMEMPGDAQMIM